METSCQQVKILILNQPSSGAIHDFPSSSRWKIRQWNTPVPSNNLVIAKASICILSRDKNQLKLSRSKTHSSTNGVAEHIFTPSLHATRQKKDNNIFTSLGFDHQIIACLLRCCQFFISQGIWHVHQFGNRLSDNVHRIGCFESQENFPGKHMHNIRWNVKLVFWKVADLQLVLFLKEELYQETWKTPFVRYSRKKEMLYWY